MQFRASIIKPKKAPVINKRVKKQIFVDKIVDPRKEPTLFNIESARMSVLASTGPYRSTRQMRTHGKTETKRNVLASETLAKLNITVTQHSEDFSLLEDNSTKKSLRNYKIMDSKDFENTFNMTITTADKFPHDNDPFLQLDEGVRAPRIYKTVTTSGGFYKKDPDLSFILSNLNILNQKSTYFGKSKYF
tara:strand:+ start:7294 stop:7863 length:570 start_codon:yes stop_codon:yes gene_type:complete